MSETAVETPAEAAETTPAPEPKAEEAKAPEKPADPPKPKPGEFARKAAAERARVQAAASDKAAKEEAAQARAEAQAAREQLAAIEKRRATYVQNPVQALLDAFPGMEPVKAFELISEAARNGGKQPVQAETYELRQRVEQLAAQREADIKAQQEAQTKAAREQAQAAERAFRTEVADFVKENAETYELTALYGQQDAVYAVIEEHYAKTEKETGKGEVLPTKKAAELVEAKLEELVDKSMAAKKIAAKIQAKFKPAGDDSPKTLSNDLATQVTRTPGRAETEAERMDRAKAALAKFGI